MPLYGISGVTTGMSQLAGQLGGSGNDFKQADYIDKWIAEGKMSDSLRGGVCQGLSAMYIASRADWSVFKNIVQTPGGVAHVRGFMNLQRHGIDIGSLKGRDGVTKYFTELVAIFGLKATGSYVRGKSVNAQRMALYNANKEGYVYVNFYASSGGHSIALAQKGGKFMIYDPNFGEGTFTSSSNFVGCVKHIFQAAYATFDQDYWAMRYR